MAITLADKDQNRHKAGQLPDYW